jgi:beta-lactamase regulating signal transducer with metallopeptidase domain
MITVARAVLDVLLASLWQGACVAIVVAVMLALAGRGLNAATRYIVLQGALLAIVIMPLLTTLPNAMPQRSSEATYVGLMSPAVQNVAPSERVHAKGPRHIDVSLSDRTVLMLTVAWLIGVLVFALRVGVGSYQLARLLRRCRRLADRDGVPIYASRDIRVPLAFGFTKPSVIVPVSLVAEAGKQFESVVLHELAHVRRGDAWANAYERIVHAFLFFNPAVAFVLHAIALEREAACDDRAVAQLRDLDVYTCSLASFAVWHAEARAVAACGVSGFGSSMVVRIRRLEDMRRNGAINPSHFALGGFAIVLFVFVLSLQLFAPAIGLANEPPLLLASNTWSPCQARSPLCGHNIEVFVTDRGQVFLDKKRSDEQHMTSDIVRAFHFHGPKATVRVTADKEAPFGVILRVMDAARIARVHISFVEEPVLR